MKTLPIKIGKEIWLNPNYLIIRFMKSKKAYKIEQNQNVIFTIKKSKIETKDNSEIQIVALDNLKRRGVEFNLPRLKERGIQFFHGDIRNKEDIDAIGKFDLMIECSAEPSVLAGIGGSPQYMINTNLLGTINCLEAVRQNNAGLIFLSTSRVYPIQGIGNINLIESRTRLDIAENQIIEGVSQKGINEKFSLEGARSLYGATKLCSEILIGDMYLIMT